MCWMELMNTAESGILGLKKNRAAISSSAQGDGDGLDRNRVQFLEGVQ